MSGKSWPRLGAAAGILHAVLVVVGFGIGLAGGSPPVSIASSDSAIGAAFASPVGGGAWLGLYIEVVAFLLFILFAARMWVTLRGAEGDTGWLSAAALGSGLVYAAISLVSLAFVGMVRLEAGSGIDVQLATLLVRLNGGLYALTWGLGGLFLLSTAAVALPARVLPRWLGWSAVLLGALLIVGMAAPAAEVSQLPPFLFLVWIGLTGAAMMRRSRRPLTDAGSANLGQPSPVG